MAPRYTIATKKAPNPIDKHVGSRVRMRRKMLAMSQTKLGDALSTHHPGFTNCFFHSSADIGSSLMPYTALTFTLSSNIPR
jgi:hypothetical protein